jgi:hypothetical protein
VIKAPRFFWSSLVLGFIACCFYANFREPTFAFDLIPLLYMFTFVEQPILLPNALSSSIPSFLHIIGMSFFTVGIMTINKSNYWKIPVAWLLIDLIFESLQLYQADNVFTWGYFDWADVAAILLGAFISFIIIKKSFSKKKIIHKPQSTFEGYSKYLTNVTVFSIGVFMILGSLVQPSSPDDCKFTNEETTDECGVDTIYLSWEKIRESGTLLSEVYGKDYQKPLKGANKIYTYQHLLLVNEKQSGVHIFDNTDPQSPKYLDFISLIGNQDMAIKDQYLYLDSFTDLVVYDLTKINEAPFRKQNVFHFSDPRDSLPSDLYFNNYPKASKGVVIGYVNFRGYKFYFWPIFSGLEE